MVEPRRRILHAAARAMARHGADTSMQDVAGEAGMVPSSLYEHFAGKDELFTSLHAELWQAFVATFDEPVPAGVAPRLALELLAAHHLRLTAAWHEALVAFPVVASSPRLARAVRDGATRYLTRLAAWLVAHAGVARRAAPDAAIVVSGVLHGFEQRWLRDGARGDPTALAPGIAAYLARALATR